MVFNLLVGHRRVFVLHRDAGELITLDRLKRELYACLAYGTAATLCIHVIEPVGRSCRFFQAARRPCVWTSHKRPAHRG